MSRWIKEIFKIVFIMGTIVLFSTGAFAGIDTGLVGGLLPQGTDYTPFTYTMWVANSSTNTISGPGGYPSGYGYSFYENTTDNFYIGWNPGDIIRACLDKEENGGTINHKGLYAVTNLTMVGPPAQEFPLVTLDYIPAPFAQAVDVFPKHVVVTWTQPADPGSNIEGYNVYRSTDGVTFGSALNGVTPIPYGTTTYTDNTDPNSIIGYYYVIKLLYKGTPNTFVSQYYSANSNPVTIDNVPPTAGIVNDGLTPPDIDTQSSTTEISANWSGYSDNLGIYRYDYAVGTSRGLSDVVSWRPNGLTTSFTESGLSLATGQTYYVSVRAVDVGGNTVEASSDGVTVTAIVPDPGIAPNYPNPFDPTKENTKIVIDVPEDMWVETYIYDITARLIWKDVRYLTAGIKEIPWDGTTFYGEIVDNGVYLVRAVNGEDKHLIAKGKIMVIKRK